MNLWAILVGLLGIAVLIRALLIGSASPGGGSLRRDEEPAAYWASIAFIGAIACVLLWKGFVD